MVAMARTLPPFFRIRHGRRETYEQQRCNHEQPSPRLDRHFCHWLSLAVSIEEFILLLPRTDLLSKPSKIVIY